MEKRFIGMESVKWHLTNVPDGHAFDYKALSDDFQLQLYP